MYHLLDLAMAGVGVRTEAIPAVPPPLASGADVTDGLRNRFANKTLNDGGKGSPNKVTGSTSPDTAYAGQAYALPDTQTIDPDQTLSHTRNAVENEATVLKKTGATPPPSTLNRMESDMEGGNTTAYAPSSIAEPSLVHVVLDDDGAGKGQLGAKAQAPASIVAEKSRRGSVVVSGLASSRAASVCPTEGEVSVGAIGIVNKTYEVGFMTQLTALMSRAYRNLYRNLGLLLSHLILAVLLGIFVGMLYFRSGNSLGGIQNRLGSLVFLLALLGFSGISAIGSFASERALYVRERAGGFYGTLPLFISKLVFDTFALRILPSFIMGTIVFVLIGLTSDGDHYPKFIVVVMLFAAEIGLLCLALAIAIPDVGTSSLVAAIIILFKMFSYEALIVNDITGITIIDQVAGANVNGTDP
ncbi:hypothetical protein HDU96_008234 [Phlyctochytrium bullatum]|nr:hypothetical protein HDU96_008234 [Phlyctochytrium bullatum]